jgi:hypothetical protein
MKVRTLLVCGVALAATAFGSTVYARGISIDGTINCTAPPLTEQGSLIALPTIGGSGDIGINTTSTGTNFPVASCQDSTGMDNQASFYNFSPGASYFYTWYDPSSGNAVPPNPTSNLSTVAQIDVLTLSNNNITLSNGVSLDGNIEVEYNYGDYGGSTCEASSASLTAFGSKYTFTGAGGASPCGTNNTNDFLFTPKGQLLGYFDASDDFVANELPPGWTKATGTSGVPEPDALGLFACAGFALLALQRRRVLLQRRDQR